MYNYRLSNRLNLRSIFSHINYSIVYIISYEIYQYRLLLYVEHSLFNLLNLQLIFHILHILLLLFFFFSNINYIINYFISVRTLYAVYIFLHMLEGEISSHHENVVNLLNTDNLKVLNYLALYIRKALTRRRENY